MSELTSSLSSTTNFFEKINEEISATLHVLVSKVCSLHTEIFSVATLDQLEKASLSAQELTRILNTIIQLGNLHAGNISLQKVDFSLQHLIKSIHQQFLAISESKQIQFAIRFSTTLEPVFLGDKELIHRAISNLVQSAIFYTQKGSVCIDVDVIKNTFTHQFVRIQVSDTGCGMSQEKIDSLMHEFDNTSHNTFTDESIGFTLAQAIVYVMGGKIDIRSKENEGTTFSLYIEWEKGNSTRLAFPTIDCIKGKFRGKRVLLVEDNDMNRFVASQSLSYAGCEVFEVINGKEAIDALQTNTFDAILMDIQMPIMDGLEATQYIRNTLNLAIPIIAHTANTFVHDIDIYLSTGMNDFISKPYDEELFYQKMTQFLLP